MAGRPAGGAILRHEDAFASIDGAGSPGAASAGWNVHLLASTLVERVPLWTFDTLLRAVARELGVAWQLYAAHPLETNDRTARNNAEAGGRLPQPVGGPRFRL